MNAAETTFVDCRSIGAIQVFAHAREIAELACKLSPIWYGVSLIAFSI